VTRASGISVPLFAVPTTRSWGGGEFPDLVDLARWAAGAGQSIVQILPVMELPGHERSPYSALTSFALDPTYISLPMVPDFDALGGEQALPEADRALLAELRQARRVPYDAARRLKQPWLRRSWERFAHAELRGRTRRADAFADFCARESWWLQDYALFRALLDAHDQRAWWQWPEALRRGEGEAVAHARGQLHAEVVFRMYVQWIAAEQWKAARDQASPVRIFGDLPFMISGNSADVWRRQGEFRLDATIGAPPDAFSEDGQDWGLPPWRWRVMKERGFGWFHARARRHADLFEGFRIDHLVGLYRTWTRPADKTQPAHFEPAEEADQRALGEDLLGVFTSSGAELIAEDLGSVPEFVRTSLARLGVPGFKVLHWERHWDEAGQPPIDPRTFAALSVATTGTHDLEPLAATLPDHEVRQTVRGLLESGSYLSLVPMQDVFGWADRINTPNVVNDLNWTWRVPHPTDQWDRWPEARERQAWLGDLTRAARR
jgi:4-alpha-glucanotransferase